MLKLATAVLVSFFVMSAAQAVEAPANLAELEKLNDNGALAKGSVEYNAYVNYKMLSYIEKAEKHINCQKDNVSMYNALRQHELAMLDAVKKEYSF